MKSDLVEMLQYAFGSVWALELLIVLRRDRTRGWLRRELVSELRSSEVIVDESIARLSANGLVAVENDGSTRYAPATASIDQLVGELFEEYQSKPAAVRRLIVQGSADKLRTFADAFRLKLE